MVYDKEVNMNKKSIITMMLALVAMTGQAQITLKGSIVNERGMLTHIAAHFEPDNQGQPNFRENDSVLLYERESEGDNITNRRSIRCQVETPLPDTLLLRLIFPQRDVSFIKEDGLYAIESSHSDGIFAQQYSGLYAYLASGQSPMSPPIDVKLLIGPPGSGKTSVALRKMVEEGLEGEGNMLLMAYTNRAVDEICKMLESLPGSPDYVRIGQETSCEKPYRHRLLRNLIADCANRKQVLERLQPIRLVCGTVTSLAGATNLRKLKNFRTAYLDEASQVLEPQLLPLLEASPRWVMIGDQKQLPAVVQQTVEESRVDDPQLNAIHLTDCRNSLFERLLRQYRDKPEVVYMLTSQGRMHPDVAAFPNQAFYRGLLKIVPMPHQQEQQAAFPRFAFVEVRPTARVMLSASRENSDEAQAIASVAMEIYRQTSQSFSPEQTLGIIVPYRNQIAEIRKAIALLLSHTSHPSPLSSVTIDTVERFQGSQRDYIFYGFTVSRPHQLQFLAANTFMEDGQLIDRKLNVALTRARKHLFVFGNPDVLNRNPVFRQLIGFAKIHNCYFTSVQELLHPES